MRNLIANKRFISGVLAFTLTAMSFVTTARATQNEYEETRPHYQVTTINGSESILLEKRELVKQIVTIYEGINYSVNDQYSKLMSHDLERFLNAYNNRTYMPLRPFEMYGLELDYDATTASVFISFENFHTNPEVTPPSRMFATSTPRTVEIYTGIKIYTDKLDANSNAGIVGYKGKQWQEFKYDKSLGEPIAIDGVTQVPVRAMSMLMGMDIGWDADNNTVYMGKYTKPGIETPPTQTNDLLEALRICEYYQPLFESYSMQVRNTDTQLQRTITNIRIASTDVEKQYEGILTTEAISELAEAKRLARNIFDISSRLTNSNISNGLKKLINIYHVNNGILSDRTKENLIDSANSCEGTYQEMLGLLEECSSENIVELEKEALAHVEKARQIMQHVTITGRQYVLEKVSV